MIKVIGVDSDDDRTLFTRRTFDEACAKLTPFWCAASPGLQAGEDVKMDALVSPSDIGLLCAALQQAMDRLELETEFGVAP